MILDRTRDTRPSRGEEREVHFLPFTTRIPASVTGLRTAVLPSMVDGSGSKRTHRAWVYVHHSCIQHSSGGAGWEYISESPETHPATLTVTLNFLTDIPSTEGAPYVVIVLRRKPDPRCVQVPLEPWVRCGRFVRVAAHGIPICEKVVVVVVVALVTLV
jgi:hypothetical protein